MSKFERGQELLDKALLPGGFAEHYLEAVYTEVGPKFAEITEEILIACVIAAVDKLTTPPHSLLMRLYSTPSLRAALRITQ